MEDILNRLDELEKTQKVISQALIAYMKFSKINNPTICLQFNNDISTEYRRDLKTSLRENGYIISKNENNCDFHAIIDVSWNSENKEVLKNFLEKFKNSFVILFAHEFKRSNVNEAFVFRFEYMQSNWINNKVPTPEKIKALYKYFK
jgi:hypothetical protein